MMPGARAKRLALAEAETLNALWILHRQHEQMEHAINELIEAVNRLGGVVGLEWNETDKKWLRLQ